MIMCHYLASASEGPSFLEMHAVLKLKTANTFFSIYFIKDNVLAYNNNRGQKTKRTQIFNCPSKL